MPLFHNATFFGSCIIQILNTGCGLAEHVTTAGVLGLKKQGFKKYYEKVNS